MPAASHRMSNTPTYNAWSNMHARCRGKLPKWQRDYVSRGIRVRKRWGSFENFLADMGIKPDGLSLERRNNNRGYSRANCVWATPAQQNRNTRRNLNMIVNGETMCVADAAKLLGIKKTTLWYRFTKGKI